MNSIPGAVCTRVTLAASSSTPTVLYALACTGNGILQGIHRLNTGDDEENGDDEVFGVVVSQMRYRRLLDEPTGPPDTTSE